jgi:hypothetical protein
MTFRVWPPYARYDSRARIDGYFDRLVTATRSIPGVSAVTTMTTVPFAGMEFRDVFVRRELGDQGPNNPQVRIDVVSTDFERTLGTPLIGGRTFTPHDDSSAAHVVIVNRALADRYYAGNAVGRQIEWNGQPWQIVGIVGTMAMDRLDEAPEPMLLVPELQATRLARFVVVRAGREPAALVSALREKMRAIDPAIAMTNVASMDERLATSLAAQRFRAALVGGLCLLAIALSIVGIYGVVAYAVSGRTREIGIRMALGETAAHVRGTVILSALRTASVGVVVGIVLASWARRWIAELIVGTSGPDAGMLSAAALIAFVIVAISAYLPARRASRIDPASALRAQ